MTTFEVDVDGTMRTVSVERCVSGRYRVRVGDRTREVDAVRVGPFGLSLLLDGDGLGRDVFVVPSGAPGELLVTMNGIAAGLRNTG